MGVGAGAVLVAEEGVGLVLLVVVQGREEGEEGVAVAVLRSEEDRERG